MVLVVFTVHASDSMSLILWLGPWLTGREVVGVSLHPIMHEFADVMPVEEGKTEWTI
jgi:hypothetical protein